MTPCFNMQDVLELSRSSLAETEKRLNQIPADLCAPFYGEADKLEQQLLAVYRTVVLCVRKEEDVEQIAAWWDTMVQCCDEFSARLLELTQDHPECGADIFHNNVLDLRNRCLRLANLHR